VGGGDGHRLQPHGPRGPRRALGPYGVVDRYRGGQDNTWAVETGTDYVPMEYEAPVVPSDPMML
jgi:hypothetical protein